MNQDIVNRDFQGALSRLLKDTEYQSKVAEKQLVLKEDFGLTNEDIKTLYDLAVAGGWTAQRMEAGTCDGGFSCCCCCCAF